MKGYIYKIEEKQTESTTDLIDVVVTISKRVWKDSKKIHIGECEIIQDRCDLHEPN